MASVISAANFGGDDVRNPPLVSRTAINERIRDALHLHIGRGRRYSVKTVSDGTGVPERCIECAKFEPGNPEHRPLSLEYLASLIKFLGVPFASAVLEPTDLGAFELSDQPPLPKVFEKSDRIVSHETKAEKQRRLLSELQELLEDEE